MTITEGLNIKYCGDFANESGSGLVVAVVFSDFYGVDLATVALEDGRTIRNIPVCEFGTDDSAARFQVVA